MCLSPWIGVLHLSPPPLIVVGSGAVAAAGCCTTALLIERLLRAVDDDVHRPSPPDTRPVGVWVAAPLVSPWSERMNAM